MVDKVQALGFFGSGSADFHEAAYYFDDDGGHDDGHDDTGDNAGHLGNELGRVAVEEAVGAGFIDGFGAEDAGHKSAPYAAHAVAAEGVQGVIVAQFGFNAGNEEVADHRSGDADEEGRISIDEAGGRGDAYEAGEDTGHEAQGGHFLMNDFFNDNPYKAGGAGSNACIGQGLGHDIVGSEAGAGVEAEPSKPQEAAAKAYVGNVMGTKGKNAIALSPADKDGSG